MCLNTLLPSSSNPVKLSSLPFHINHSCPGGQKSPIAKCQVQFPVFILLEVILHGWHTLTLPSPWCTFLHEALRAVFPWFSSTFMGHSFPGSSLMLIPTLLVWRIPRLRPCSSFFFLGSFPWWTLQCQGFSNTEMLTSPQLYFQFSCPLLSILNSAAGVNLLKHVRQCPVFPHNPDLTPLYCVYSSHSYHYLITF